MRATRIVEAGLWLVAAACAFWSALWVLGPNGFGRLRYDDVPRWLDPLSLYGGNARALALPSVPVAKPGYVFLGQPSPLPRNYAALFSSDYAVLQGLTNLQQLCYVGLHLLTYAVVAFIAVTLAQLVGTSRTASPFSEANARRLRVIGLLLVLGAPLASLASWACERWLVESSSVGDEVATRDYVFASLPLWTMLVGAAVLVLAGVWRRGVAMAEDVRGLV